MSKNPEGSNPFDNGMSGDYRNYLLQRALFQSAEFTLNYLQKDNLDRLIFILSLIFRSNGTRYIEMQESYYKKASWDVTFKFYEMGVSRLIIIDEEREAISIRMLLPLNKAAEKESFPLDKVTEELLVVTVSDFDAVALINYEVVFNFLFLRLIGAMQAKSDEIIDGTLNAAAARMNIGEVQRMKRKKRKKGARRSNKPDDPDDIRDTATTNAMIADPAQDQTGISNFDLTQAMRWASDLLDGEDTSKDI